MLAGIPIGVAYAQDPAITVAITTALGSAPRLFARETAIGSINAVVAVFDIKFVSAQVTMNMTRRSTIGLGSAPRSPVSYTHLDVYKRQQQRYEAAQYSLNLSGQTFHFGLLLS